MEKKINENLILLLCMPVLLVIMIKYTTMNRPLFKDTELFPRLKGETLTGKTVTFPEDLENDINILILVFKQEGQYLVDTWAGLILKEYEPKPDMSYFEVPMLSIIYKPISWQIDKWMRDGIPKRYHENTVTFYGDRSTYMRQLGMNDKDSCYIFVLDREGEITFRSQGSMTAAKERAFRKAMAAMVE